MSNLTGQQINQTYPGLLNLQDATSGITSDFQQIQDGLGNNTNSRISTSGMVIPNIMGMNINSFVPDAVGTGVSQTVGYYTGNGSQNNLTWGLWYDTGVHSYSSITVNLSTVTTTSDVVELYFYDLQYVNQYGIFPRNLIMSGITLPVSAPTGIKTVSLPSTLSFSGLGGGYYAYVLKITNGGVNPTVRYNTALYGTNNQAFNIPLGIVRNNAGNGFNIANRAITYAGNINYYITNQTTPATFTQADIISRFNSGSINNQFGFNLNVIK